MGHGLLRAMQGYWNFTLNPGDDRHAGRTLTDVNTVSIVAQGGAGEPHCGNMGDFEKGNSERLTRVSEAALQGGPRDFFVMAWFKIESFSANHQHIISKTQRSENAHVNSEYTLKVQDDGSLRWIIMGSAGVSSLIMTTFTTGIAYHIIAVYEALTGKQHMILNGFAEIEKTAGFTPTVGAAAFHISGFDNTSGTDWWDGLLDEVTKVDRIPVAHEWRAFYNHGEGRTYKSMQRQYRGRSVA